MNIIKNQIKTKTQMISATWSRDFEEHIDSEISKILQEQIDWETFVKTLVASGGWNKVTLSLSNCDRSRIESWCKEHICGMYESRGSTWVFKEEKDYMLFVLRWT
jgi:hypothetical protein